LADKPTTEEAVTGRDEQWLARPWHSQKLARLRRKLYAKAKREPNFRFYALYDRIYRKDVLHSAWRQVRRKDGAPGVDGVSIDQIGGEEDGPQRLVDQLHEELRTKSYRPQPVKRVYIPKVNGDMRPLGIPTVRDRVVQTAALLILEPIFEADFEDCSYGFRPQRSAHQALSEVKGHIKAGKKEVLDADLKGYFDSIPHDKLMKSVEARVSDGSVLRLIQMWLRAPVVDEDDDGPAKRNDQGTPQGGVISPLLANLYLHWLDKLFYSSEGPGTWANARLVRYADDFVILAKYQGARIRSWVEWFVEDRLGLELNRRKTRTVDLEADGQRLNFLGYTFWNAPSRYRATERYLRIEPSKKALKKQRRSLKELTGPQWGWMPIHALIRKLNRQLRGWSNYFSLGHVSDAYARINHYVKNRLETHFRRRSQRPHRPPEGVSYYKHIRVLGFQPLSAK